MNPPPVDPSSAWTAMAEALLIGVLVGVQRETTAGVHPGLRDFIMIALAGGICGLLGNPWLAVAALLSITALFAVFHFETRDQRAGLTTELAGVAVFCMAFLTATPGYSGGAPLAMGLTIAVVTFLEMKKRLQTLLRETITEVEFNDTLRFLAVVLVIYPLLPKGTFGPYNFFSPRQVWMFVILVGAISYVGYFLTKFLGSQKGLEYTSVLGGLASTTAATLSFARAVKERPNTIREYWQAAVTANCVQFPRALVILYVVNADLANLCAPALAATTLAGVALAFVLRPKEGESVDHAVTVGNPFQLWPALKFGMLFTAILFINKMASVWMGSGALYATSALGGLVDPATVIVSANDLLTPGKIDVQMARTAVFVGLLANVTLKIVLASLSGTVAFTWRITVAFAIMLGAGAAVWLAW